VGAVFGDDMINVTSNAAAAIAFRNAVFKGVPKPIWNSAYEATRKIVRGDEQTLGARRVDLLVAFRDNLKIDARQGLCDPGREGREGHRARRAGLGRRLLSALKNNEITLEDLLREVAPAGPQKTLSGAFGAADGAKPQADAAGAQAAGNSGKAATPDHDPVTGEVKEPAKPAVEAKGGEVIIEGPAPAGVVHFHSLAPALDPGGRRVTFKDGSRYSSAKPTADIPVYTELAPEPAPAEEGAQAGESTAGASTSSPASESQTPAGTGTAGVSDGGELEFEAEDEDDEAGAVDEEPEVFTAYRENVSACDSWLTVKAKLGALRKTDEYKAAAPEKRLELRLAARDVTEALRATNQDPVDPKSDPEYYALWVEAATAAEAEAVWPALIRTKAYQGLKDELKDGLAAATEKARSAA
jgi:hypothetical protein